MNLKVVWNGVIIFIEYSGRKNVYDVLFICIDKVIDVIFIVHKIDVFVWDKTSDLFHFRFMPYRYGLGETWYWCVNIILKYLILDPCLWLLWSIWFLDAFLLIKNGPLKGHVSNFPSFCINRSLTSLLSITHPKRFYFRYGGYKLFNIWKGMNWYCWS